MPLTAAKVTASVYVRKGMVGKAWWDNVVMEVVPPKPVTTLLLEPAYRGRITSSWPPKIRIQINVADSPQVVPASYDVAVTLKAVGGTAAPIEVIHLKGADLPPNRSTVVEFNVDPRTGLPAGDYTLAVAASKDGVVQQVRTYNLTRVNDAKPAASVYVDGDRRLIVDGKPLFPLGMYAGDLKPSDFDKFHGSAFNCIMPYKQMNKTQLDLATAAGVKIAYTGWCPRLSLAYIPSLAPCPRLCMRCCGG